MTKEEHEEMMKDLKFIYISSLSNGRNKRALEHSYTRLSVWLNSERLSSAKYLDDFIDNK